MSYTTSRSVKTYTKTTGSGKDAVTKKITEVTETDSSGKQTTKTTEEVITGVDAEKEFSRLKDYEKQHKAVTDSDKKDKSKKDDGKIDSKSLKEFRKEALQSHNSLRSKHGVPSVKLTDELNNYAQDWADHLVKTGSFQHSSCALKNGDKTGENIATKWSSASADYSGKEVTEYWYSEIEKYHAYGGEPSNNSAGHFTQVIWKETKEMGIGKAKDGKGRVIVVGSYKPPGNLIGSFGKNVFRPK